MVCSTLCRGCVVVVGMRTVFGNEFNSFETQRNTGALVALVTDRPVWLATTL